MILYICIWIESENMIMYTYIYIYYITIWISASFQFSCVNISSAPSQPTWGLRHRCPACSFGVGYWQATKRRCHCLFGAACNYRQLSLCRVDDSCVIISLHLSRLLGNIKSGKINMLFDNGLASQSLNWGWKVMVHWFQNLNDPSYQIAFHPPSLVIMPCLNFVRVKIVFLEVLNIVDGRIPAHIHETCEPQ